MSSISAGTTTTTGYVVTSDTNGSLVLKTGASDTTAVTINGSQNVTFAGSQTLSAGTANGVTYLNGSKVLTSGSALTFDGTNLAVGTASPLNSLVVTKTSRAGFEVSPEDATNVSLYSYNRNTSAWTNLLFYGSNQIFCANGTTEGMRLTSTGLGIGTSSPATKLNVSSSTTNTARVRVTGTGSTAGNYRGYEFANSGGFSGGIFQDESISGLSFWPSSSGPSATLDSTGNLGLGVTPSAWNSVYKAMQFGPTGAIYSSSSNDSTFSNNTFWNASNSPRYLVTAAATYYYQYAGAHTWATAPSGTAGNAISFTQAMTLDASGNLLVGTTSSTYSAANRGVFELNGASTAINALKIGGSAAGYTYHDGTIMSFNNVLNGAMAFATNNTERARIDSSGNLLVGTTTSSVTSGNGIKLVPGTSSACNIVGSADTNANFAHTVYSTSPAAYRFQVGWGGTIYATSTSISAISDQTLKTNVRDLETGITEVMALKPRRFDWINGDATDVAGFIAQEVEQVLPELVDDYLYSHDEDGNNIIKKSLKMGDILPTLVKAIQEQQAIIESLKARLDAANI
jgi:hypothetical protein